MYVFQRFALNRKIQTELRNMKPDFGFGGFGEIVFYRTYSRLKKDGSHESWADCVIRVINGIFSIRMDWYIKNHIEWDANKAQEYAAKMAISMFKMEWLPPGRGLWMCGTDYVYEKGSMALYNCAYVEIRDDIHTSLSWAMDCLMCGVGVGFTPVRNDIYKLYYPGMHYGVVNYEIEDSREGWIDSVKCLLKSYIYPKQQALRFGYDNVRPQGCLIKGFGGVASGPDPLRKLHEQIRHFCDQYIRQIPLSNGEKNYYDTVMLKTDIMNAIGCTVTSGGVRRSAELGLQLISDPVFKDLKNYNKYPYRAEFGWMSNNTVALWTDEDFESLDLVAERVKINGEPGIANLRNFPQGRVGKKDKVKKDKGTGLNPCGEIILESYELCNLAETFPTRCPTPEILAMAREYATYYCSSISLLPTHSSETNKVIARNRRIGVSLVNFIQWKTDNGTNKVTKSCRDGYKWIRKINKLLAREAGVPASIRVTTIKPGGSVPKLAGCTNGYPNFRWMIRRIRVQEDTSFDRLMKEAKIPWEKDYYSDNTNVFEYPIFCGSMTVKTAEEVTLWEQAMNVVLLQREWADNAVSNTLMFKPAWVLVHDYNGLDLVYETSKFVSFNEAVRVIKLSTETEIFVKPEINTSIDTLKIVVDREKNTLRIYRFDPKNEENDIEPVLSAIAPLVKNVTILPHTPKGVYKQMPEEGITEEEFNSRLAAIRPIDWSKYRNESEEETDKYCSSEKCEIPVRLP